MRNKVKNVSPEVLEGPEVPKVIFAKMEYL